MSETPRVEVEIPSAPERPNQKWRRFGLVVSVLSTPVVAALGVIYELEWAWTLVLANGGAIGFAVLVHAATRRLDLSGFATAVRAVGEAIHGPK